VAAGGVHFEGCGKTTKHLLRDQVLPPFDARDRREAGTHPLRELVLAQVELQASLDNDACDLLMGCPKGEDSPVTRTALGRASERRCQKVMLLNTLTT
jgi:hypothetical protein